MGLRPILNRIGIDRGLGIKICEIRANLKTILISDIFSCADSPTSRKNIISGKIRIYEVNGSIKPITILKTPIDAGQFVAHRNIQPGRSIPARIHQLADLTTQAVGSIFIADSVIT